MDARSFLIIVQVPGDDRELSLLVCNCSVVPTLASIDDKVLLSKIELLERIIHCSEIIGINHTLQNLWMVANVLAQ